MFNADVTRGPSRRKRFTRHHPGYSVSLHTLLRTWTLNFIPHFFPTLNLYSILQFSHTSPFFPLLRPLIPYFPLSSLTSPFHSLLRLFILYFALSSHTSPFPPILRLSILSSPFYPLHLPFVLSTLILHFSP